MENATHRTAEQIKILRLLAKEYPGIPAASATLVSLNALCNLPKGTEHFMSDLHGEAEAFEHILNNCSASSGKRWIISSTAPCRKASAAASAH